MLVCAFLCATLHTRPRVQRAPGIPCSLCLERESVSNLGQSCREKAKLCLEMATRHTLAVITRLVRNCALVRVIQYSRDASDGIEKPRCTGYPACAGYDGHLWCCAAFNRPSQTPQRHPRNPDASAKVAGGFRRCRRPPTGCAARRAAAARRCPDRGCRNRRHRCARS